MAHMQEKNPGGQITFTGKLLRVVAVTAAAFFLFLLIWFAIAIPLLIFGAVLVATLVRSMSTPLARLTGLPGAVSVFTVMLALAVACYLVGMYLAPHVGVQADQLQKKLPAAIDHLQEQISRTTPGRQLLSRLPALGDLLQSRQMLARLGGAFSVTINLLTELLIFLFASLYLTFDPDVYVRGIVRLVPAHYEDRTARLFDTLSTALRRWLLGRLTSMTVTGLITGVGLWLLGIPLALTLGLLAGLLTFIPYLGPIISAVPAVLLALLIEPAMALWVIVLYLGAHTVEAYVVSPLVQQHQVQLPPVLTLTSQILLSYAAGLLGLMLATPLTAMLLVCVKVLYVEDVLGKKARMPGRKE